MFLPPPESKAPPAVPHPKSFAPASAHCRCTKAVYFRANAAAHIGPKLWPYPLPRTKKAVKAPCPPASAPKSAILHRMRFHSRAAPKLLGRCPNFAAWPGCTGKAPAIPVFHKKALPQADFSAAAPHYGSTPCCRKVWWNSCLRRSR